MKYILIILFTLLLFGPANGQIYHVDAPAAQADVIRVYSTPGVDSTWVKPTGLKGITIIAFGAGGGGGSGRRGALGSSAGAGGGGGGGGMQKIYITADSLYQSSYTVKVGAGGQGGAAVTTDATNGNPGQAGDTTRFGTIFFIAGAQGGSGGTTSTLTNAGAGSSGAFMFPGRSAYIQVGGTGSQGNAGGTAAAAASQSASAGLSGRGGGGGGGISSSNRRNGGAGGTMVNNAGSTVSGGSGGTTTGTINGGNGADDINTSFIQPNIPTSSIGVGSGGGGGAGGSDTIAGGTGGNGGRACGGGGGGGSYNGANSGAGGNGGNGFLIIVEHY